MTHPDPGFPALHGRPPRGWLNDPNGCAYVDGRYHVFFQHNPHAPVHDRIMWGHVSSADLVSWRPEPIALTPRAGAPDAYGCWSGCLVLDDGVPTAVYSAVRTDGGLADVLLARGSADLRRWRQEPRPVAPLPADPRIAQLRDPFLVTIDGRRCAVQGAGAIGGPPQVLLYDCTDLTRWVPLGPLLTAADPVAAWIAGADMWECPNLVRIGEKWVLVVSLWRHRANGGSPLAGVRYLIGDLVVGQDGPRFAAESGGELDRGDCFYAPQLLVAGERVLLWGWAKDEDRPVDEVRAAGWSGSLTYPRELAVSGDAVVSQLVPELVGLRDGPATLVAPGGALPGRAFEVALPAGAGPVELVLVGGSGQRMAAAWTVRPDQPSRAMVDGSMIEIEDGGGVPRTVRAYPRPGDSWRLRTTTGHAARAWRLRDPAATQPAGLPPPP